ncbi:MAG TPA: universal stress protein [Chloroflexota bacterium]|jgi:nucleotide-binding universal stress UspA family protein|nr:universal stress protein [Chloroflexota bacterium]
MVDLAYRRIMIATDGSDEAAAAADHGIAIARAFNARVLVVAVLDIGAFTSVQTGMYAAEFLDEERAFLQKSVDAIVQRTRAAGITEVTGEVIDGVPRSVLITIAQQRSVDLIVAGSHGRGLVERLLVGSTTEHLVRHAPCPVLVVRPPRTRGNT